MDNTQGKRNNLFGPEDHAFIICAYKESPFLAACISSLKRQNTPTTIYISTSTPNSYITELADKYKIKLFVNHDGRGIAHDWNAAIHHANKPLVTIAHQDDVYCEDYSDRMLRAVNAVNHPLIFFTNYAELRSDKVVKSNHLLSIKRFLLRNLIDGKNSSNIPARRRALSLGSSICCPSVTLAVCNLQTPIFKSDMKSNLDWEAWERISRLAGDFYYDSKILMYHRIHEDSETTHLIHNSTRTEEDYKMLKHFWPVPVANAINHFYSLGQNSNRI